MSSAVRFRPSDSANGIWRAVFVSVFANTAASLWLLIVSAPWLEPAVHRPAFARYIRNHVLPAHRLEEREQPEEQQLDHRAPPSVDDTRTSCPLCGRIIRLRPSGPATRP